jgi:hypothetical protein
MPRREIGDSDLTYNRAGKLSEHQRFRMRMGIIIRGLIGLIPAGLLASTLYVMLRGENLLVNSGCWIFLGILALVTWLLSVPAFRHVSRLVADLRGAGVAEDCGVLTLEVYTRPGRSGGTTRSFISVDNTRQYVWNLDIAGGFINNDMGCVYYGRNSKLVLSIETFTQEEIERM